MMLISSGEPKGEVAAGLRLLAPLAPARLGRGATCRLAEQRVPGLAIKRERDSDKSKVLAFSNFLKNHAKHHTGARGRRSLGRCQHSKEPSCGRSSGSLPSTIAGALERSFTDLSRHRSTLSATLWAGRRRSRAPACLPSYNAGLS